MSQFSVWIYWKLVIQKRPAATTTWMWRSGVYRACSSAPAAGASSPPSPSLRSTGRAPPNIFVCCSSLATWFTGSLMVLGNSFNLGLAAASSAVALWIPRVVFDVFLLRLLPALYHCLVYLSSFQNDCDSLHLLRPPPLPPPLSFFLPSATSTRMGIVSMRAPSNCRASARLCRSSNST